MDAWSHIWLNMSCLMLLALVHDLCSTLYKHVYKTVCPMPSVIVLTGSKYTRCTITNYKIINEIRVFCCKILKSIYRNAGNKKIIISVKKWKHIVHFTNDMSLQPQSLIPTLHGVWIVIFSFTTSPFMGVRCWHHTSDCGADDVKPNDSSNHYQKKCG